MFFLPIILYRARSLFLLLDLQTLQGRIASEEKRRDSVLRDLEELKSQFSQAQREQLSVQSRPSAEAETLLPKGGAAQPTASRGRWWIGVAIAFVIGVGVGIGVSFLIPRFVGAREFFFALSLIYPLS